MMPLKYDGNTGTSGIMDRAPNHMEGFSMQHMSTQLRQALKRTTIRWCYGELNINLNFLHTIVDLTGVLEKHFH